AADPRPWDCAEINWATHGLERPWPRECFIYLNPPFDRYEVGDWIARLAEHGNGITLLRARTEAERFEPIWQGAAAILFMADRSHFHRPTDPGNQRIQVHRRSSQRSATKRCCGCIVVGSPARL